MGVVGGAVVVLVYVLSKIVEAGIFGLRVARLIIFASVVIGGVVILGAGVRLGPRKVVVDLAQVIFYFRHRHFKVVFLSVELGLPLLHQNVFVGS